MFNRVPTSVFAGFAAVSALIAFAACQSFGGSSGPANTPAFFQADTTLDAAIAQANREGKVVFAVASGDPWCAPCQSYKRGALADERVAAWVNEHAVPVYISAPTARGTPETEQLGIRGFPTTVIIAGDGPELFPGNMSTEELLEILRRHS